MPFDNSASSAGLDRLVQSLSPAVQRQKLAVFAKEQLKELQQAGSVPVGKNAHRTFVNAREGVAEEQVQLPGPIVYVFNWLDPVVKFALAYLENRAPVASGAYKRAFVYLINGVRVPMGKPIPADAEVTILNVRPYARKIDVGAMKMTVPPHLFNDAYNAVRKEFRGMIKITVTHVSLSNGYVLKRSTRRRHHTGHVGVRSDRGARGGEQITYPALVITAD